MCVCLCVVWSMHWEPKEKSAKSMLMFNFVLNVGERVGVWFGLFIYCIVDNKICFNSLHDRNVHVSVWKWMPLVFCSGHNISNFLITSEFRAFQFIFVSSGKDLLHLSATVSKNKEKKKNGKKTHVKQRCSQMYCINKFSVEIFINWLLERKVASFRIYDSERNNVV